MRRVSDWDIANDFIRGFDDDVIVPDVEMDAASGTLMLENIDARVRSRLSRLTKEAIRLADGDLTVAAYLLETAGAVIRSEA